MGKMQTIYFKKAIEKSVNKAIKDIGMKEFKKCSFFMSNKEELK